MQSAAPPANITRLGAFAAESWATTTHDRKVRLAHASLIETGKYGVTVRVGCQGCSKSHPPTAGSSRQGERGMACRAYKTTLKVASCKGGIGFQCSRCWVRGEPCTLSQDRLKPVKAKAPENGPRNKGGRPSLNRSESEEREEMDRRNALRRERYHAKKQRGIAERLAAEEEAEAEEEESEEEEVEVEMEEEEEEEEMEVEVAEGVTPLPTGDGDGDVEMEDAFVARPLSISSDSSSSSSDSDSDSDSDSGDDDDDEEEEQPQYPQSRLSSRWGSPVSVPTQRAPSIPPPPPPTRRPRRRGTRTRSKRGGGAPPGGQPPGGAPPPPPLSAQAEAWRREVREIDEYQLEFRTKPEVNDDGVSVCSLF